MTNGRERLIFFTLKEKSDQLSQVLETKVCASSYWSIAEFY